MFFFYFEFINSNLLWKFVVQLSLLVKKFSCEGPLLNVFMYKNYWLANIYG